MNAGFALAFIFLGCSCRAQTAENLFSRYWKIGVTGDKIKYFTENEPNSIDYKLFAPKIFELGITWNFYQKGNHNLKASIIKPFKYWDKNYLMIKAEDIPYEYEYILLTSVRISNRQWKANVLYEYFFRANDFLYFSAAAGPEVLYYPKIRGRGTLGIANEPDGEPILRVTEQTERIKDINLGIKSELSAYLASPVGLLQFKGEILLGFNDYQKTDVQAFNLAASPDSNSKHIIKGHYLGLGISYFLPKKKKD